MAAKLPTRLPDVGRSIAGAPAGDLVSFGGPGVKRMVRYTVVFEVDAEAEGRAMGLLDGFRLELANAIKDGVAMQVDARAFDLAAADQRKKAPSPDGMVPLTNWRTKARLAVLKRDYPRGVDMGIIIAALRKLPGPPLPGGSRQVPTTKHVTAWANHVRLYRPVPEIADDAEGGNMRRNDTLIAFTRLDSARGIVPAAAPMLNAFRLGAPIGAAAGAAAGAALRGDPVAPGVLAGAAAGAVDVTMRQGASFIEVQVWAARHGVRFDGTNLAAVNRARVVHGYSPFAEPLAKDIK
jgi:hypothetical protein